MTLRVFYSVALLRQLYPVELSCGDDIRVTAKVVMHRGFECGILLRGIWPDSGYLCTIGAYQGRWMTINRIQHGDIRASENRDIPELMSDDMHSVLLGIHHLRSDDGSAIDLQQEFVLTCEVVGGEISISVLGNTLTVYDPCPLVGVGAHKIAVTTQDSQLFLKNYL